MPDCIIENLDTGRLITLSLNEAHPQFILKPEAIAEAALEDLRPEALDLLDVAATVFYADGRISRGGEVRTDMGSGWHRNLRLTIPVRCLKLWRTADVGEALVSAVNFLTGDRFEFNFIAAEPAVRKTEYLDLDRTGAPFGADDVIMFSGGLDSFAGALETLAMSQGQVILVSHQSATKVVERQDDLARHLAKRFGRRVRHIKVKAHLRGEESTDTTQRSRSFLFAAMGAAVAQAFRAKRISFFENGVVSHNLPISPQVVGTMATRTTHPLVLARLSKLISLIMPSLPRITNPFEWMTKSDVVERIRRHGEENKIGHAVSCTHVRDQTTLKTHCGTCSQCQDRRFAILAQGLAAFDPPESYASDVLIGERVSPKQRTMAVEWTRHAISLANLDEKEFFARFGVEITQLIAGYPDLPQQETFSRIFDLHQRQSRIVFDVMTKAVHEHAGDLAAGRLSPASLLVLHMSHGAHTATSLSVEAIPAHDTEAVAYAESATSYDPNAHPILHFQFLNGRHEVAVRGLCNLIGNQATVIHHLKTPFEEDRIGSLAYEAHRFVSISGLKGVTMSKDGIRTALKLCRKAIENAYMDLHHSAAPQGFLVQTGPARGHRLNPRARIMTDRDQ